LYDSENVLLTNHRFLSGNQLYGTGNTPDAVQIQLDQSQYKPGDIAKLKITAPYKGAASLVLASNSLHSIKNFQLDSTSHELEIQIDKDWGGGTYALVTVYRPGQRNNKGAGRAVGLVWISIDPVSHRLDLEMNIPERVRPRQPIDIPISVQNGTAGDEINLTLSAVDDGVLQMTRFTTPDPIKYFFGKQRLGTEIRDLYGRLITAPNGKPIILRQGAGDSARRGVPETNVRVVSLFSGVVKVGTDGFVTVPLTLPDFNGRLRLMAVAWSKHKLGSAAEQLSVSDPVVVSPSLPRFLARNDMATINLLLQNIDGPEGNYKVKIKASGALGINGQDSATLNLTKGKRHSLDFHIKAENLGHGQLQFQVNGPDGYQYSGDFPLNVRGRYLPLLQRTFHKIDPGESLTIDGDLIAGLYPETATVDASFSSSPNLDVPGILGQLDRYPYGCLEQLTSRAMPLLYANELAGRWDYPIDNALHGRIQEAIELIFQKQRSDGSFGLWSYRSHEEPWLSAYAMDFFTRARATGFQTSDYLYNKGMQWLAKSASSTKDPDVDNLNALTYAHYVLARAGQGKPEDARYLFDNYLEKIPSALGVAHIAGALSLQGDTIRAITGFAKALTMEGTTKSYWHSYGSPLRDNAGIIHVLHESGKDLGDPASLWDRLVRKLAGEKYLSTQEQAWLVMAALTLDKNEPLQLTVNGVSDETKKDFFLLHRENGSIITGSTIQNKGKSPVWAVVTVQGTASGELPPVANRFGIERKWLTLSGEPLDPNNLQQGDLVVVLLNGEVKGKEQHRGLVVDLLPAGFEFEKTLEDDDNFSWLPELSSTRYTDGLDDRFVAAIDTDQLEDEEGIRKFRIAYLARAVTPGRYSVPPAEVEDMYNPEYRARTRVGTVSIEKAVKEETKADKN
jgi:uncharacterized protein YfaS (alpha-2-macroglobulin family)